MNALTYRLPPPETLYRALSNAHRVSAAGSIETRSSNDPLLRVLFFFDKGSEKEMEMEKGEWKWKWGNGM